MEIKKMSNKKLIEEFEAMHQTIYDVGCYGTNDLRYYYGLETEIVNRGLVIHTNVSVSKWEKWF